MIEEDPLGTIVVSKDKIMKILDLNDTHGVDDRVIRLFRPLEGHIKTDVRRAFKGSERYPNPKSAPIHIDPTVFVPEYLRGRPERYHVDCLAIDVPDIVDDRTDEEQERFNESYNEMVNVWKNDVTKSLLDRVVIGPVYPHDERLVFDVEYES